MYDFLCQNLLISYIYIYIYIYTYIYYPSQDASVWLGLASREQLMYAKYATEYATAGMLGFR